MCFLFVVLTNFDKLYEPKFGEFIIFNRKFCILYPNIVDSESPEPFITYRLLYNPLLEDVICPVSLIIMVGELLTYHFCPVAYGVICKFVSWLTYTVAFI